MTPSFHALNCYKQLLTHVAVGMGAASFWRGAWYVLDDQLFPENPNLSAITSLALGTGGMAASQGIVARAMAVQKPLFKPVARFGALYTIAMSCVLVWRGTWVGWDCVYEHYHNQYLLRAAEAKAAGASASARESSSSSTEDSSLMATSSSSALEHSPAHTAIKSTDPGHLTVSGFASHSFAIVALMSCGVFASVLAPPAAVSVIKDLAIQASKHTAKARTGTTTAILKSKTQSPVKPRDDLNNQAYEFLPFMSTYLTGNGTSALSSSRNMSTKASKQTTLISTKTNNHKRFFRSSS